MKIALGHLHECKGRYWLLDLRWQGRDRITIVAFVNEESTVFEQLRIFPRMNFPGKVTRLYPDNQWLKSGTRLEQLSDFMIRLQEVKR